MWWAQMQRAMASRAKVIISKTMQGEHTERTKRTSDEKHWERLRQVLALQQWWKTTPFRRQHPSEVFCLLYPGRGNFFTVLRSVWPPWSETTCNLGSMRYYAIKCFFFLFLTNWCLKKIQIDTWMNEIYTQLFLQSRIVVAANSWWLMTTMALLRTSGIKIYVF